MSSGDGGTGWLVLCSGSPLEEGAMGFWIIPWCGGSVVSVQLKNWLRPAPPPLLQDCKSKIESAWLTLKLTTCLFAQVPL